MRHRDVAQKTQLTRNPKPERLMEAIIGIAGGGQGATSARDAGETATAPRCELIGHRDGDGDASARVSGSGIGPLRPWKSLNTAETLPAGSSGRIGPTRGSWEGANGFTASLAACSSPWNVETACRKGHLATA